MFAERRRFFENLIEQERLAKEKAGIKIKPNPKRIFKPKTSKPLIEEPPKSVSKPKIAFPPKKVSNKIKIIPSLPDRVVWNILDYLDYQQQCKAERVSQRWKKMVRQKQRREIRELTVELVSKKFTVIIYLIVTLLYTYIFVILDRYQCPSSSTSRLPKTLHDMSSISH